MSDANDDLFSRPPRPVSAGELRHTVAAHEAMARGDGEAAQREFAEAIKAHAIANRWPEAKGLLRGTAADSCRGEGA